MKTRKITDAYREISLAILLLLAAAGIITAFGFAIVTPLWIAATRFKDAFTLLLFAGGAGYMVYLFVTGLKKKKFFLKSFAIFMVKSLLVLAAAVLLLSSILLLKNGIYLQGFLIIGAVFIISGIFRFFNF
ncbi:MAG: hypothetical protein RBT69_00865 [Spirochaetia bacterium]|jgi:hypothetical protein|nr:hypothetical protein [Spirochaetia bacterium]